MNYSTLDKRYGSYGVSLPSRRSLFYLLSFLPRLSNAFLAPFLLPDALLTYLLTSETLPLLNDDGSPESEIVIFGP